MNEIAVLQRHVVLRMGLPAVQFLSTRMLPSLGLSETLIQVRARARQEAQTVGFPVLPS